MPKCRATRGCGRSTGGGPFTIGQAVDDLDQVRAALGFDRWAVAGHSWGAELALRYAARHQGRTTAVAYIAGVGAGNGFRNAFAAEQDRRLGPDRERLAELSAIPAVDRTPEAERERCLLQWRTDFSPTSDAAGHAQALWDTRPPGAAVNMTANRELREPGTMGRPRLRGSRPRRRPHNLPRDDALRGR